MLAPAPAPAAPPMPAPGPALFQPVQSPSLPSSQQYGVVTGNWQVPRPPLLPGSYVQGAYSPVLLPPGMVPFTGWSPYAVCLFITKAFFVFFFTLCHDIWIVVWSI